MAIHDEREQASKIVKKLGATALPLREGLVEAYVGAFVPALSDAGRLSTSLTIAPNTVPPEHLPRLRRL